MNRLRNPLLLACMAALALLGGAARAQSQLGPGMQEAMAALGRGDFQTAEQKLRAEVAARPDDAWAASLLGAALDNLQRGKEADAFHRRAVAKAPRSVDILTNYAAHLWLSGDEPESGKIYRQIVAIDPVHAQANLQLARLALKSGDGAEALRCLDRLPAEVRDQRVALLPRLEAMYRINDPARGQALADRLLGMSRGDPDLAVAAGVAIAGAGQFDRAEAFLEAALKSDPANFALLYQTGVAAARAGHAARAREVLEAALRQQPGNVDVLYALACADHAMRQWEPAVQLLSQAAKLDPKRADVQRMLAVAATDLGALEDAAAAWDRYLVLQPNDAEARRERGYTAAQRGHGEEGLPDLEWYVARHPKDAVGHYELGQAVRSVDIAKSMAEFDRALALDAKYVPARTARGSLYYQMGKPEEAVKDLEAAAAMRPDDAANLDRLGQTYQALDRTGDAVRVLRRAADLAPGDSKTLLHFARALAESGKAEESKAVMDRFRQLGPEKQTGVRAGFVEYLGLSDAQRHADYKVRLEKAIQSHPEDPALRLDRLKLLLTDGEADAAEKEARAIETMKPGAALLADAGRALLAARKYGLAAELLRQAGATDGTAADLAIATKFAKAESLAPAEAAQMVEEAIAAVPDRPDLYRHAAVLLATKGRTQEAAKVLAQAVRALPADREIALMSAAAGELAGKSAEAEAAIERIRNRWPEWRAAWTVGGVVLDRHGRMEEARQALETAIALGESGPEVHYYLAHASLGSGHADAAEVEIAQALRLAPQDPWIAALSATVALERGEREAATERLRRAIQLRPEWLQPHLDLARVYRALGRGAEAQNEEAAATKMRPADDPPYLLIWLTNGWILADARSGSQIR